jgi:hypothetical protein
MSPRAASLTGQSIRCYQGPATHYSPSNVWAEEPLRPKGPTENVSRVYIGSQAIYAIHIYIYSKHSTHRQQQGHEIENGNKQYTILSAQ